MIQQTRHNPKFPTYHIQKKKHSKECTLVEVNKIKPRHFLHETAPCIRISERKSKAVLEMRRSRTQ